MKKFIVAILSLSLVACLVPKKKLDDKQHEADACYKALQEEHDKKQQLAAATADLQSKLDALNKELDDEKAKGTTFSSQVEQLQKDLQDKAAALAQAESEKAELQKKSATYDDLVRSLQGEIDAGKVKITEAENRLSVELIDKVVFDSGSTEIKPEGQAAIAKVAAILKNVHDKQILVEGHTDNVPLKANARFADNWDLSTARATTVVRALANAGVDAANLGAAGYAFYRPVATNDSDEGRHQNRRIEIVLTPKPKPVAKD